MRLLSYVRMPNHWQERTARELGLESSLRLPGSPKKTNTEAPRNLT
jgi:hypothetical protein